MSYGAFLERRRFGVFYFRQTVEVDGRQLVRRISLRTKDAQIAKFIALQMRARSAMIDLNKLRKFEVVYDSQHNVQSVKVTDDSDARNLQAFMQLQELHRAEQHRRELELLKFKQEDEAKEKAAFAESERGQQLAHLYDHLQHSLPEKKAHGERLDSLKTAYLAGLKVTPGTLYKYQNFIDKLIDYAGSIGVHTVDGVDRKFVWKFVLFLRSEKKQDATIKNIFNTLSSFYNHLLATGDTKDPNPFVGHKLAGSEEEREPFTNAELEKIFSSPAVRGNRKLFYVLMLLATTGARPNEICQLWTDDIVKDGDLYTIRITDNKDRDQSLKNKSSRRTIYLHRLLVNAGFVEYVTSRPLGMVFDLKRPAQKTYSTFISEDFTAILRKDLKIADKTMYCLRHTAINRMKTHKVDRDVRQDLVGHEGKSTAEKHYEQRHAPAMLRQDTEEALSYREVHAMAMAA